MPTQTRRTSGEGTDGTGGAGLFIPVTNLCERSFVEERRRTKVIPRFTSEKAAMKLVFATLIRAADRWCRVSITDLERHQLKLLRAELGLDPPPTTDQSAKTARQRRTAA
jgi:putative transposase